MRANPIHYCTGLLMITVLSGGEAQAHEIHYQAGAGEAVTLELSFAYGSNPIYEPFRVYRPAEDVAFQTGRTDALGRLSFLPDRPGDWRVQVTAEDGHGIDVTVSVDEAAAISAVEGPGAGRFALMLAGIGYLLGIAGAWVLFRRRGQR